MREQLDLARPKFLSERAKEIFASFDRQWADYQRDMQKALALAATRKTRDADAALDASLEAVRDKANTLDGMLDELTKQKEARAKAARLNGRGTR